ncbi:cation transporter [Methylolobus aquaticus]|nr:cation transporter [Methylolobus aquaticus]
MTSCQNSCGCTSASLDQSTPLAVTGASADRLTTASLFSIPKMDCPSEERLIRMALDKTPGLVRLEFDLSHRELRVLHDGPVEDIAEQLRKLGLGSTLRASTTSTLAPENVSAAPQPSAPQEAAALQWLLGINGVMFVAEMTSGWLAQSTGLIADSLDMFADAAVYGLALYAVGRDASHQLRSARFAGWLQMLLALGALSEVLRRFIFGSDPEPPLMLGTALAALVANVTCLIVLARHRNGGVHMQASWIFSTNDVLANLGVIAAALLVAWTGSNQPDLVIGTLIALLVLNGARRILRLQA